MDVTDRNLQVFHSGQQNDIRIFGHVTFEWESNFWLFPRNGQWFATSTGFVKLHGYQGYQLVTAARSSSSESSSSSEGLEDQMGNQTERKDYTDCHRSVQVPKDLERIPKDLESSLRM